MKTQIFNRIVESVPVDDIPSRENCFGRSISKETVELMAFISQLPRGTQEIDFGPDTTSQLMNKVAGRIKTYSETRPSLRIGEVCVRGSKLYVHKL